MNKNVFLLSMLFIFANPLSAVIKIHSKAISKETAIYLEKQSEALIAFISSHPSPSDILRKIKESDTSLKEKIKTTVRETQDDIIKTGKKIKKWGIKVANFFRKR